LRGEQKEAEEQAEAAEALALALANGEVKVDEEGEETKEEDGDEEGEGETKEEGNDEEGGEEAFVEDLLGPVASEETISSAAAQSQEDDEAADNESGDKVGQLPTESFREAGDSTTDGNLTDRKQSVHVGMDDIFMRAPSQEALEKTSQLAQARTEALRNRAMNSSDDTANPMASANTTANE